MILKDKITIAKIPKVKIPQCEQNVRKPEAQEYNINRIINDDLKWQMCCNKTDGLILYWYFQMSAAERSVLNSTNG